MKDISFSNDKLKGGYLIWQKIQKRNLPEKLKKSKLFALQLDEPTDIQKNGILLTRARYIDCDESDMKEDILSVSELPLHTSSSEIVKVLNGFIEERSFAWKICIGVCTDGAACLAGRISGLVTKIKDMAGNILFLTHCYIHRQNLTSNHLSLMKFCLNLLKLLKNSTLNTRLLKALCGEMGSDHQNLLFQSEVHWLSLDEVL